MPDLDRARVDCGLNGAPCENDAAAREKLIAPSSQCLKNSLKNNESYLLSLQEAAGLPITCVTLGSPLVGNKRFKELFEALEGTSSYRIVHGMDPVPMLPPDTWGCDIPSCQTQLQVLATILRSI